MAFPEAHPMSEPLTNTACVDLQVTAYVRDFFELPAEFLTSATGPQ